MRTFGTLVLALFVSGLVAGMLQNVIAVRSGADLEFVLAMLALMLLTFATTIVLGIALAAGWSIDRSALWLVVVVALLVILLEGWSAIAARNMTDLKRDALIVVLYIAVPALLMIAIQWLLVRRVARAASGG
jgi:hypothetical protein